MTKVTLHYDLARTLTDEDYTNIAALHSVYGMARVQVTSGLDKIVVDYDASRLTKKDVEATLSRFAVPAKLPASA